MNHRPLVFATRSYDYLAAAVCRAGNLESGPVERRGFPDGERYLRLGVRCHDRDVVVVGGTIGDEDTLELYDLACGAVAWGARRLTVAIPYFGYSTMERSEREGEIVTAKARARLLSSVPAASMGNRVLLLDLHAEGVAHYFEGDTQSTHVYGRPVIAAACKELGGDDYVLACTDAGRAKWVESLANALGVEAAFVYKRRLDGERTEVTGVSAHVPGRVVVIYDDMIRTGGSLLGAARAYLDAGAVRVAAVCTHGLFPGDALGRLAASGALSHIVATDSHPRAVELASGSGAGFLSLRTVAPLLAERLAEGT
jgi:ribose-phosphate pyrophosphokinase